MDSKNNTPDFADSVQAFIDSKTKPPGSLGIVEQIAAQLAISSGTLRPAIDSCELILFAADHGIATTGVSAYPQEVTRQMVLNILEGGAASAVFARSAGVSLSVVDAGVRGGEIDHPSLINRRVGDGTANSLVEAAMTAQQCDTAMEYGDALSQNAQSDVLTFGEMGIGNTASAALVAAKILGSPVSELTGRGTGLDDAGLAKKSALLQQASARTAAQLVTVDALREYGGFEIAMMTGAMMGAANKGSPIIVDGFICSVAALCAQTLSPASSKHFIFAHASAERGHRRILEALNVRAVLDLELRLGEGTGALLAWPILRAAAKMLTEMATFKDAGVSGRE
ncbi:MAG: nicotinate-nucleotide--dimethylbenzimidazole phosphoribosyltransferase [Pseudomonadota bacterium]